MPRTDDAQRVLNTGLVAILRADDADKLADVAEAIYEGGVDVIEITFTVPRALEILAEVSRRLGDRVLLGAGTVLDPETARAAMLAGAEFIVAPNTNTEVIRLCRRYDKVVMPGAFTPTEVVAAWEAGADFVKIFPADAVGPEYLKALRGPLPQVRMIPTGGVNLDTIESFFAAGASAVGLGSALVDKQAVRDGDMHRLRDLAGRYVAKVQSIREQR